MSKEMSKEEARANIAVVGLLFLTGGIALLCGLEVAAIVLGAALLFFAMFGN